MDDKILIKPLSSNDLTHITKIIYDVLENDFPPYEHIANNPSKEIFKKYAKNYSLI